MQEINAWLLGDQSYNDGLELYGRYGKSSFLKELFANGPTPYNKEKLEAELKALAPTPPAIKAKTVKHKAEIPEIPKSELSESKRNNGNSEDSDIKAREENHKIYLAFQEDNKAKYRQLERNMTMLDFSKDEQVLHLTAKQILALHKKIQENYKMIDYFDEFGYFPFQKQKVFLTDEAQRIYVSLSKSRKRLASGKCKNIAQTQKLIERKLARLAELNGKVADE